MAEATTPLHSAPSGKRDRGRGTPTGQTAQRPMKRVSLREKEPPSRPCSIAVTENSLENLASAHERTLRNAPTTSAHFSRWRATTATKSCSSSNSSLLWRVISAKIQTQ